jgi:hypothetical protein
MCCWWRLSGRRDAPAHEFRKFFARQTEYADHVMQGINTFRSYIAAWYDDELPQIFFAANHNPDIMRQICSVLAGYVWDKSNPYVSQADRALGLLAKILKSQTRG